MQFGTEDRRNRRCRPGGDEDYQPSETAIFADYDARNSDDNGIGNSWPHSLASYAVGNPDARHLWRSKER
jgi:hypothetical protein